MDYPIMLNNYITQCEASLELWASQVSQRESVVSKAALYSLMNGGKRVRGVFVLAVCDMLGGDMAAAEAYASAIEMVHAFSLIHDDLPCMDNDDMRRGKPACHKAYGEANALLAGDLLALEAFEVAASVATAPVYDLLAVKVLAGAAGARGMIYGQELDLYYENRQADEAQLLDIHSRKTGALFRASVQLGILAARQPLENHLGLVSYAENIGYAFQVIDDILDVTSSEEVLGKPIGSDAEQGKNTFVTIKGLEDARRFATALTDSATGLLRQDYGDKAGFLCDFASSLAKRIR